MKTLRLLGMALFAVLMCVNFASCSNEEIIDEEAVKDKYITVGLNCVGEYLDITNSPLSRAKVGDDIYRIGVSQFNDDAGKYIDYAYGEFATSLDGITIRLLEGADYKFTVSIIVGGVYKESTYNTSFTYGKSGISAIAPDKECYYGELEKYTAIEGKGVSINTKRVSFGAEFIAEDLTEGKITIIGVKPEVTLTPEEPKSYHIHSFSSAYGAWLGIKTSTYDPETGKEIIEYKNYTEERTLEVYYTNSNGEVTPLGNFNVTFKRNIKTTIRIKVGDLLAINNTIAVTREETEITNDDNEYIIEGGKIIEVPLSSSQS